MGLGSLVRIINLLIAPVGNVLMRSGCQGKKATQTFLHHLPVPVRLVVKSFEVFIISVSYVENSCTCRFPVNL